MGKKFDEAVVELNRLIEYSTGQSKPNTSIRVVDAIIEAVIERLMEKGFDIERIISGNQKPDLPEGR